MRLGRGGREELQYPEGNLNSRKFHLNKAAQHKECAMTFPEGSPERRDHLYAANMHNSVATSPVGLTSEHKLRTTGYHL